MNYFNNFLTFDFQNEHDLEHDLNTKSTFSTPKVYIANGDLNKRWYVYFSFRNPKTGRLKRMKNIYGVVNSSKNKEDRLSVLSAYRRSLIRLLKAGYNPFEKNEELFAKRNTTQTQNNATVKGVAVSPKAVAPPSIDPDQKSVREAFDFALDLKKRVVNITSFRGLNNRMNNFLSWIESNRPEVKTIDMLNKKVVNEFLNYMLTKTSPRNRNNFRTDLSSILQLLEDNDMIPLNFIKNISILKSTPKRNKTYSLKLQEEIYSYLKKEDPILLLYIKFISYNFLRPIEVCRLKVKDLNLVEKKLQFKAKNSPLKTKIIPQILCDDLPDLSGIDKELWLFTPDKIGGDWDAVINNKRDYFSKRFKKVVKKHFNLGSDYGLYSFRHTFITKLYREIVKDSTPFAAKSKLMLITGHASMDALNKYLRDIDAELPDDYSDLLK